MEKSDLAIIENTFAGREEFGLGCWRDERTLTGEQINALLNGKCLAVSIKSGVFFITRFDGAKSNIGMEAERENTCRL